MKVAAASLTAVVALWMMAPTTIGAPADESARVPKKALDALRFFVGNWESETIENGEKIGQDSDKRRWAPGKHCVTMVSSGDEGGALLHSSGLSGWDAKSKQLLEHWYGSRGLYAAVGYPLDGMGKDVWKGTFTVIFADGKAYDGECELEKTEDGFVWTARWKQEGKEFVRKSIARRVKRK